MPAFGSKACERKDLVSGVDCDVVTRGVRGGKVAEYINTKNGVSCFVSFAHLGFQFHAEGGLVFIEFLGANRDLVISLAVCLDMV